jgi:acyl carrier protein
MTTLPDSAEILARLRRVVPDGVGIDAAALEREARLSDIGIDSYSLIELVFLAEEEFDVRIPFEGLVVKTVGDIVDIIRQRMQPIAN